MVEKRFALTQGIAAVTIFAIGTTVGFFIGRKSGIAMRPPLSANVAIRSEQTTKPARPMVLLGIAMNQPLALPECEKKSLQFFGTDDPSLAIYNGSVPCFVRYEQSAAAEAKTDAEADPVFRSRRNFSIKFPNGSEPLYVQEVSVSTLHGRVAEIDIRTTGETGQQDALADLKRKFGDPMSANTSMLQNGFGAQFQGINAFWNVQGVTVELDGIGASRDKGSIRARNRDFANALRDLDTRHPSPHL